MRTRSQNSCSCRPGLAEDAIQPVLPSSGKREYSRLVFTYNKAISTPFSDILTLVFLKIIFFTIFAGNISKLEKKALVYVHHCLCVLQSRPWMFLSAQWRKVNKCKWSWNRSCYSGVTIEWKKVQWRFLWLVPPDSPAVFTFCSFEKQFHFLTKDLYAWIGF